MDENGRQSVGRAAVLLGLGFGGFFDGIVLHQILQWHHMVTSAGFPATTVANLQLNTLWDGLFHVVTLIFTLAGVILLWRAGRRPGYLSQPRLLVGGGLLGWGLFNVVEGVINHHILQIHHVREAVANPLPWDLAFLVWGLAMILGGWLLMRSVRHAPEAAGVRKPTY